MERKYKIANLKITADFRHSMMTSRSEKYLCDFDGETDIQIPYNERITTDFQTKNPHLSLDECEVILTTRFFYNRLLSDFDGFMLHSSAVAVDGKAYLFSAPSGTGKSTHTEQWLKLFGERAEILNDDKPAIRFFDGKPYACGTPWSGKSDLNVNKIVPLQGICVLERSEENFIEPMDSGKALFFLMNQTLRSNKAENMDKLLNMLDMTFAQVKIWHMGCNISVEAAEVAYKAMSAE